MYVSKSLRGMCMLKTVQAFVMDYYPNIASDDAVDSPPTYVRNTKQQSISSTLISVHYSPKIARWLDLLYP